jgi:hypothetical protein
VKASRARAGRRCLRVDRNRRFEAGHIDLLADRVQWPRTTVKAAGDRGERDRDIQLSCLREVGDVEEVAFFAATGSSFATRRLASERARTNLSKLAISLAHYVHDLWLPHSLGRAVG